MSINPRQPSFYQHSSNQAQGIPATDFDNMSDEEIRQLINSVNASQGKAARVAPQQRPKAVNHVDLDQLLEGNRG